MSTTAMARVADAVLVTGCSTGLGLEIALYLAERGYRVYATMRDLGKKAELLDAAAARRVTLEVRQLDVTDPSSVEAAIKAIVAEAGQIFGLVNNAGIGLRGCLEDLSAAEVRQVFETNVLGTMLVTQRVLPHMRQARRGRIVTISSVGGRISTFGLSAYCASKFALEGFGEALALEVAPFGLQAVVVEPGIIKTTRWTSNRGLAARALDPASPYHELFRRSEALADRRVQLSKTRPVDVARTVHHALTTPNPRMHYVVGRPASVAVLLRRYLPDKLFERLYFGTIIRGITRGEQSAKQQPVSG